MYMRIYIYIVLSSNIRTSFITSNHKETYKACDKGTTNDAAIHMCACM